MSLPGGFDVVTFNHNLETISERINVLEYELRERNAQKRIRNWIHRYATADDESMDESLQKSAILAKEIQESLHQLATHLMQYYQAAPPFFQAVEKVLKITRKLIEATLITTSQMEQDSFQQYATCAEKFIRVKSLLSEFQFVNTQNDATTTMNVIRITDCFIIDESEAMETIRDEILDESAASFKLLDVNVNISGEENNTYEVKFRRFQPRNSRDAVDGRKGHRKSCLYISGAVFHFTLRRYIPFHKISNPFVLVSHQNMYPDAWATMLWDTHFVEVLRKPFIVPEYVTWPKFVSALDEEFLQCGRRLTQDNEEYLKGKFVPTPSCEMVTWSKFCIETSLQFWDGAQMKNVSLSHWLFHILKLLKPGRSPGVLQEYWRDGKIVGFSSEQRIKEFVRARGMKGAFAIRFSETLKGAVTIWHTSGPRLDIQKCGPFRECLLNGQESSLAQKIWENTNLQVLHTGESKRAAFPLKASVRAVELSKLYDLGYNRFN